MKGEYYLGLDMGSSSVGWAVTNEKYEILRAHGKTLWGVRLFDSAQTAEERRGFRTAKRRLDRRNWRIELLQKIFAEEVEKIDDGFFRRMKESRYWPSSEGRRTWLFFRDWSGKKQGNRGNFKRPNIDQICEKDKSSKSNAGRNIL